MHNKFFTTVLLLPLVLAACGQTPGTEPPDSTPGEIGYTLKIDSSVLTANKADLVKAAIRVVERQAVSIDTEVTNPVTDPSGNDVVIRFTLKDAEAADTLNQRMTDAFTFRLMRPVKDGEKADVEVEKRGGYKALELTEKHVKWVVSSTDPNGKAGVINIQLTSEGVTIFRKILTDNKGEIGIFVRDRLVSVFQNDGTPKDDIVITGVPTADMGTIFADDVNVGVHVMFDPL